MYQLRVQRLWWKIKQLPDSAAYPGLVSLSLSLFLSLPGRLGPIKACPMCLFSRRCHSSWGFPCILLGLDPNRSPLETGQHRILLWHWQFWFIGLQSWTRISKIGTLVLFICIFFALLCVMEGLNSHSLQRQCKILTIGQPDMSRLPGFKTFKFVSLAA